MPGEQRLPDTPSIERFRVQQTAKACVGHVADVAIFDDLFHAEPMLHMVRKTPDQVVHRPLDQPAARLALHEQQIDHLSRHLWVPEFRQRSFSVHVFESQIEIDPICARRLIRILGQRTVDFPGVFQEVTRDARGCSSVLRSVSQ